MMTRRTPRRTLTAMIPMVALWACAQGSDIDQTARSFDAISDAEVITLSGTEPFWSIELTPRTGGEYSARLVTPDDMDGRQLSLTRFAGNNGLGFNGTLDGVEMQIAITPAQCSDGMSDRTYPFDAIVVFGTDTLRGCAHSTDNPFRGGETP